MFAERIERKPVIVLDLVIADENKKFAPAGLMATAILDITQEQGGCLPQDLHEKGFKPEDIVRHWPMAQSIAFIDINYMGENPKDIKSMKKRRERCLRL